MLLDQQFIKTTYEQFEMTKSLNTFSAAFFADRIAHLYKWLQA